MDETMTTSTSSTPSVNDDPSADFDDDNLFPASEGPRTPLNDHLNASAPGELSPPRSQGHGAEQAPTLQLSSQGQTIPNGAPTRQGITTRSATAEHLAEGARTDHQAHMGEDREQQPGWGWKSKKAQEEYQRAWESIVDRDFTLKEYGDVVLLGKEQLE